MPRPTRIEYEGALYHVMNRGRGRQFIFHDDDYYRAFLEVLEQSVKRFSSVIHAYCLMGNHYHLLIQTPEANLGRVMRHINGVYTQRHNRLRRTDGPLFRGRYKAIVVEADAYLLQVSRYIHRNPVDMKHPLVDQLEDYRWSSYPAYLNREDCPAWLTRDEVYGVLGAKQRYAAYRSYVEQGVDEETGQYYNRGNTVSVIGGQGFREWLAEGKLPGLAEEERLVHLSNRPALESVVSGVARHYGEPESQLRKVVRGRGRGLESRKVAMYLCQQLSDARLGDIAEYFGLSRGGSVSFVLHQVKEMMARDRALHRRVNRVMRKFLNQDT